jgi:cysteinyl-tRNA synthetase
MHNGFVRVDDEKMSKSLGNFFTVRDVLPRLRPEVLRAFLLASHYRAPVNYTDENLRQADASLQRLYLALRDVEPAPGFAPGDASRDFAAAMDDDFNTPGAIAVLQSAARALNVAKSSGDRDAARALAAEMRALGAHIGLLGRAPEEWLATRSALVAGEEAASGGIDVAAIEAIIAARIEARRGKNFAESDRIRDELAASGILLEDGPGGTTWRRK